MNVNVEFCGKLRSVKIRFIKNAERPLLSGQLGADLSCSMQTAASVRRAEAAVRRAGLLARFEKCQNALNPNFSDI